MAEAKRLIEAALPVKEISAESVRDKSIRHGHISTLHLWWARRPLPVCRAVVFASLVPDPLDDNCPEAFRQAVRVLLGKENQPGAMDRYRPYGDLPFTSAVDSMEDNLRNRLLMFIGKFTDSYLENERKGKPTPPRDQLSDGSLVKWESRMDKDVLSTARRLIWVAHDPERNTLAEFDRCYGEIGKREEALCAVPDRHLHGTEAAEKEGALADAIRVFQARMPIVFDPFAGGGAIPLEASRLGCRSHGNDLNPVAHIIQKGSLEFPQKYGKPIVYSRAEFENRYGIEAYKEALANGWCVGDTVHISNRLSHDVDFWARGLVSLAEEEIGRFYPADEKGNKPVAYYWARVATCSNPSCGAEVPLLRQFYLVNKPGRKIHLKPVINKNKIDFIVVNGTINEAGWMKGGNLTCPCCGNLTSIDNLKEQFKCNQIKERCLAIISETDSNKEYTVARNDYQTLEIPPYSISITEKMEVGNNRNFNTPGWGIDSYKQMFSPRQLLAMQTFVEKLAVIAETLGASPDGDEYPRAVVMYLGILIDRLAAANTSFGIWHTGGEKLERIMGRQAIPMVFDYPESNPFCGSTGSAANQIEWITRYIDAESSSPFPSACRNAASGDQTQFAPRELDAVVTDPPYYDAIAYADLSDFFYVWLKRTLSPFFPLNFAFPQTPKADECTALKHHHEGSVEKAKGHFEEKLRSVFSVMEAQTRGVVSVMFAHQSTEAWSTLCSSILNAGMNITSSWANDTEMTGALKTDKAFLSSSVTVTCRPAVRSGTGDYRNIRIAIRGRVREEVRVLHRLGFRGADLLTACFGQAAGEFGRYERVEKADGTEVTVPELLALARDAAFDAIVSDIDADEVTRFYIGWLNLFGFSEADHDDARRITQIGLNMDTDHLTAERILVRSGNRESLSPYRTRYDANAGLGKRPDSPLIDVCHRLMGLFADGDRNALVSAIAAAASDADSRVWRVLSSLAEVLPAGCDDNIQVSGLLANRKSLIHEAGMAARDKGDLQGELDM